MLYTDSTVPNALVLEHLDETQNMPVECDILDLNVSMQTQYPTADEFCWKEEVPLYIWNNRNSSKDYKVCIQQNGDQFGHIPLNDLKIYWGPKVLWKQIPSIV